MKNKNFFYTFIALTILVITYGLYLASVDFNKIISEKIKTEFPNSSIGNIVTTKFPFPYTTIHDFSIDEKFKAAKIEFNFSLLSLLKFSPLIKKINLLNSTYNMGDMSSINNYYDSIKSIFSIDIAEQIYFDNLTLYSSDNTKQNFFSKVYISTNLIHIETDQGSKIDITKDFTSNEEKLNILTETEFYKLQFDQIHENGQFKSALGKLLFKQKNSSDSPAIDFNIENIDGINIVKISSDLISGTGKINSTGSIEQSINFDLRKLDLSFIQNTFYFEYLEKFLYHVLSLNMYVDIDINLDEIIFNQEKFLTNNLKIVINSNNIEIKDMSGNIDSFGSYGIEGNFTLNSDENNFEFGVELKHTNVSTLLNNLGLPNIISSNVPIDLALHILNNNSSIKLDSINCNLGDSIIKGNLDIRNLKDISVNLNISNIDIKNSNYPYIDNISQYLFSLMNNIADNKYLAKYVPIRKIDSNIELNLSLDNAKYESNNFNKINLSATILPASINIKELYINNNEQDFTASISLNSANLTPYYNINITGNNINISDSVIEHFRNFTGQDLKSTAEDINLAGNINLNKAKIKDLELDKININFVTNQGNIVIQNSSCNLAGGNLVVEAVLNSNPLTFNAVYGINSFKIEDFLSVFIKQIKGLSGLMSSNGKIGIKFNPDSNNIQDFAIESNFLATSLALENYSPDNFIQKLSSLNYDDTNFDDYSNLIFSSTDQVSNISGSCKLDNGILEINNMNFITKYSTGISGGFIDLINNNVKLQNIIAFYINPALQAANKISKVKIDLEGNLDSPKKTVDLDDIKQYFNSKKIN